MADKDSLDIYPSDAINVIGSTVTHDQTMKLNKAYQASENTARIDTSVIANVSPEVVKGNNLTSITC
jgi:hypothetical protein